MHHCSMYCSVLEFSREIEPTGYIYIYVYKEMYYEKLTHVNMEAENSQDGSGEIGEL